jgi:prepilin-type N-terminal cleavage/methylation domain-containing protein
MSSMVRKYRAREGGEGTGGFSLAEVLVALAVAAMMAAMLTRFVAGTRMGAAKVGERAEMVALSETLLARVASSQALQRGRTDGQAGIFAWHIDITPASFEARALSVTETAPAGLAGTAAPDVSPHPVPWSWAAYRVAVVIEAPSGQSHVVDTVRLGPGGRNDR